ncbi:MAG TPA: ABC transporter permease [Thermomicrobiales bacterium]|nr:ABC transporter permease [Thermomicrobiales bacterium]
MAEAVVGTGAPSPGVDRAAARQRKSFLRVFIERNKVGMIGYVIFGAILIMSFIGPLFLPDENPTDVGLVYAPPSWDHPLGTDWRGQDVLYQIINGGAGLLIVSMIAAGVATAVAVIFGALAGLIGGRLDSVALILADVVLTVPFIILLGVLAVFVRLDNIFLLALVLAAVGWPTLLRAVRAQVLSLKEREYVEAARMLDLPMRHVLFREVLPNMMPYIIINFVLGMTNAIYGQIILYYLGLVPLQGDNWGLMIQQIQSKQAYSLNDAFVYVMAPIVMISLLQLSLVLISRTLEDVFNPRLREV